MKRIHSMPYGATVLDSGECRFRLWAPGARAVDVCVDRDHSGERSTPMSAQPGGWFECTAARGSSGTRYRFRIDGGIHIPDPASRSNPLDVHGPSEVIDPRAFEWQDDAWQGRPWEEAVLYELHVGSFTPEGTFRGVESRLDYLADLGITAVELMPVADFPGRRDWGYDGVLPFAPDASYGTPDDLKRLVQAAHRRGLMMFLDVVYNHFGPEGNYLHACAPQFFTERHQTPWGAAIDFEVRAVRDFFIHNALYWLEEFHFDGLRFDAVHAIRDGSAIHILDEIADAVHAGPGRNRHVHLVLENDDNASRLLNRDAAGQPRHYTAQWNDDFHHAAHVALTGEADGYYADFVPPMEKLGRCLTEGFAYQGEPSPFRGGEPRGEPSRDLPPGCFVNFLQNHDQVGNRALGERLAHLADQRRLAAAAAVLLLAPSPPLFFMGDEFAAATPFLFFCDLGGELAAAVRDGRRREFSRFARFADVAIPDPGADDTFKRSKLDWDCVARAPHAGWLKLYRELLGIRAREIVPLIAQIERASWEMHGDRSLKVRWQLREGSVLVLLANFGHAAQRIEAAGSEGRLLYASDGAWQEAYRRGALPTWSAAWVVEKG